MNGDCLKFRVWDDESKQYDTGGLKIKQDGWLCVYHDDVMYNPNDPAEGYTVEHCTGLKDKMANPSTKAILCSTTTTSVEL